MERPGSDAVERVLFETTVLIIRGAGGGTLPLDAATDVSVESGIVRFARPLGPVVLHLGADAAAWAAKIASPPSLAQRLGIKAGARCRLVRDVPQAARAAAAAALPEQRPFGVVFAAFEHRMERDRLAELRDEITASGAIWSLRRNGSPYISEADAKAAAKRHGLVDVKVARVDAEWTAEKLVIPVASRPGRAP